MGPPAGPPNRRQGELPLQAIRGDAPINSRRRDVDRAQARDWWSARATVEPAGAPISVWGKMGAPTSTRALTPNNCPEKTRNRADRNDFADETARSRRCVRTPAPRWAQPGAQLNGREAERHATNEYDASRHFSRDSRTLPATWRGTSVFARASASSPTSPSSPFGVTKKRRQSRRFSSFRPEVVLACTRNGY